MKLLALAFCLHLINESLQRLTELSEVQKQALKSKPQNSLSLGQNLQQSACKTKIWSEYRFCASCSACPDPESWDQYSLIVTCKPCTDYFWKSSDTDIRFQVVSTSNDSGRYLYRTDCGFYSDENACSWNATVQVSQNFTDGYMARPIPAKQEKCMYTTWPVDNNQDSCFSCKLCNATNFDGNMIYYGHCDACRNYTWETSNKTIATKTGYNSSGVQNMQYYWYGDCRNSSAPIKYCNICLTCIRSYDYVWQCGSCRVWDEEYINSNKTYTVPYTFNRYDEKYGLTITAKCENTILTNPRSSQILSSWVNCWPGSYYKYLNMDYVLHTYNTTNTSSTDSVQRIFNSDCENPINPTWDRCRFSVSCSKNNKAAFYEFQFDCFFTQSNPPNFTKKYEMLNVYSQDSERGVKLGAECLTSINEADGFVTLENCRPLGYSWLSRNRTVSSAISLYNTSSSSSFTTYFATDCDGPRLSDCHWVTGCNEYRHTTNGFYCWVINARSEVRNPKNTIKTRFEDRITDTGLLVATNCSYTKSAFVEDAYCEPVNYQYQLANRTSHSYYQFNYTSGRNSSIFGYDCESKFRTSCHFVARCYYRSSDNRLMCSINDEYLVDYRNRKTVFKYNLGAGNIWCTSCTYDNSTVWSNSTSTGLSCQSCGANTTEASYTTRTCGSVVKYFDDEAGNKRCANCTACTIGYYNCEPCGYIPSRY
jgi:hypothetical protein